MALSEIDLDRFNELFGKKAETASSIVYNSAEFNRLNAYKTRELEALVLFDEQGEAVAGQIFGLRDGIWRAPFSAPFSTASTAEADYDVAIDDFYKAVSERLNAPIRLVWAPGCYNVAPPTCSPAVVNDFNYHYPLKRFADFESYLSRSGRYNHHRAMKHDFKFFKTDDVGRAYGIIDANRRAMGYPLAMTQAQVEETIRIVPADFFILTLDGKDVAAAMLYRVTATAVQLIYWGDLPAGRQSRAMNHLAWRVFGWYAENCPEIDFVDVGPASTDGVRNEGLCQFKLSIGCVETMRQTIML